FAELGEAAFRDGERKVIARLVAERPARVIATGGGAFMDPETRAFLKAEADTVWIDAALETLWDRVKDKPGRPLLETDDPRGTLAALLERRAPVYAEADHRVVSEPDQPHEAVVARILETLGRAAVSYPPEGNYDD
ncbi:MAG: shikimate kinase, partial [Rubricella sp.]